VLTNDEILSPGPLPLWSIPGWRNQHGVVAGITGRGNGSEPDFDLGLWTDQPVGAVMARWRAFRIAQPEFPAQVLAHQVHGNRVLWHQGRGDGWTILEGADGHATSQAGLLLMVTVADCVPVYLVDPKRRAAALLHAGWRGTAANILAAGVAALTSRGSHVADLVMHAGIGISGPRYQVGREVIEGVGKEPTGAGPWQLDIRQILVEQAIDLGLQCISASSHCTAAANDRFFSHRASQGSDGRMVAFLGFPAGDSSG
jgi:YfiH family protein